MITLSNGHSFEYMVASGGLAFDGKGWPWEKFLVWLGIIKPKLFTIVTKTLTRYHRKGNLRMWWPFSCIRPIPGGWANKVGLTNGGFEWWQKEVAPNIDFKKNNIIVSIYGDEKELTEMAEMLNYYQDLKGLEVNVSCPNSGHPMDMTNAVIKTVRAVVNVSIHPVIVKISVDQDYKTITRELAGIAEAISLNSVPWNTVYKGRKKSPLWRLEKKVGGGGGGVSGRPAQQHNWKAVEEIAKQGTLPVIGPSVMDFKDLKTVRGLGAQAIGFGSIHIGRPWAPTRFVEKERKERRRL